MAEIPVSPPLEAAAAPPASTPEPAAASVAGPSQALTAEADTLGIPARSGTETTLQPASTDGSTDQSAPTKPVEGAALSPELTKPTARDLPVTIEPADVDRLLNPEPLEDAAVVKLVEEMWEGKEGAFSIVDGLEKAGALNMDRATVAQQLHTEARDPKVTAEIERRRQVQEALAIIRIALDPKSQIFGDGRFQAVDQEGRPSGNPVRTQRAVMPIIGQLRIVAQDQQNPSSARAKAILSVLEPRIVESRPGEHFFDNTANLEHRRAAEAVSLAWEVLEFRLQQLGLALPHEGQRVNIGELEELVKKHDPTGDIGRLGLLLVDYSRLDPYKHAEARFFDSALIYQALKSLNVSQKGTQPDFVQRFREIVKNSKGFERQLSILERRIVLAAQLNPDKTHIGHDNLLTVAVLGYICNGTVKKDQLRGWILPPNIEAAITAMVASGRFTDSERDVVLSLASIKESAEKILSTTLQLNLRALKENQAAMTYAADAVDGINAQRTARGETLLEPATERSYRQAMQYDLEISLQQAQKDRRFGGILTTFGLLGVIFLPSLQGAASVLGQSEKEQQQE
ncbi:hypothetical protein FJY90_06400 [Candidatus Gottesmanbacteria bacterium]|nr:hypothetical protein [Candidatus Gottesmanbacteria bacterium]